MPEIEGAVTLSDQTLEITAFLQECLELLEAGQEDRIISDPFYQRADDKPPLSDEQIDRLIAAMEEEYAKEIERYPDYHKNLSGALYPPQFTRLSPTARRAMAERLDAIISRYAAE